MGFSGLFYPWGVILQAAAIVHFIRRRPDTYWLWIILIGGGIGALVYLAAEVLPDANLLRGSFTAFSRRRRIRDLEAIILENTAIGNFEELADLYLDEGKFARARQLYDKVIATRTDSLDPFYRRGLAALAMGDAPAALTDLERVVSSDPKYDFYRAMGVLAQVHSLAGQAERAEELFKNATTISTLSETYYNYAAFLASQQRLEEARAWAEKIIAKAKTLPRFARRRERPWVNRAKALIKKLR